MNGPILTIFGMQMGIAIITHYLLQRAFIEEIRDVRNNLIS